MHEAGGESGREPCMQDHMQKHACMSCWVAKGGKQEKKMMLAGPCVHGSPHQMEKVCVMVNPPNSQLCGSCMQLTRG